MNLIWVVFAHFIGDWGLQNPWVAENKGKCWMVMIAHCMVWTGTVCFVLNWLGLFALWKLGILFAGHMLADKLKCMYHYHKEGKEWMLYLDQVFHLVQCLIVYVSPW